MSHTGNDSAFPILPPLDDGGCVPSGYPYAEAGLTKREFFAAMAMQGMLARRQAWDDTGIADFAGEAVDYADALIKALSDETKVQP